MQPIYMKQSRNHRSQCNARWQQLSHQETSVVHRFTRWLLVRRDTHLCFGGSAALGCAKKQSVRRQSSPNRHGLFCSLRFRFFSTACPPPHLQTDGAALAAGSLLVVPSFRDFATAAVTPLLVYTTSCAATVTFCSTHSGQRSGRVAILAVVDDKHASQHKTGTPQQRQCCFPM